MGRGIGAQAQGGARSRGPPWGPPWGRVDTNDLHTAALRRRPAAGGPRPWGSALQGSQRAEVSNACSNQPLPRHAPGDAAAATLPSRPPRSLSCSRTSEAGSLNGWEGAALSPAWGPQKGGGLLPLVGGCRLPLWGAAEGLGGSCRRLGRAGKETTGGLDHEGLGGGTPEGSGPGEGLCENRQGGQRLSGGWSPPHLTLVPSGTRGQNLKEHGGLILTFSLGHPRLLK